MKFLVLAKWDDIDNYHHQTWWFEDSMEAASASKQRIYDGCNDITSFWVLPLQGVVNLVDDKP
jgi:hypothetical protein